MAKIIIIDDMGNTSTIDALDDKCIEIRNAHLHPCSECGTNIVLAEGWNSEQDCCIDCAK